MVRCKVKEISVSGKKKVIKLTVNPKEVNSSIVALKNGMVRTKCLLIGLTLEFGTDNDCFISDYKLALV